jgi:ABC-type proline/glycine betaine transport system permease subunit
MKTDVVAEALTGAARLFDAAMAERTWAHAGWVAFAMSSAAAIAIPCVWIAARSPVTERGLRRACDLVSSVPALAWLGLCATLLESGAAIACFLLAATAPALLRGALDGLRAVDRDLVDVAIALGLRTGARARIVAVPMALPATLRGLREASTYASGATALAAIAGAGGYGTLIVDGIVGAEPSRMLMGGCALALFTALLRLMISAVEIMVPPLWGARMGRRARSESPARDASR